jgi:hypothetical protein
MRERPIIFNGEMVRAILAGTKTQTRRVLKPQPELVIQNGVLSFKGCAATSHVLSPYGQHGDRLWVREAWRTVREADDMPPRDTSYANRFWYEADAHADHHGHQLGYGKLRPSMFMPRWASRITLEITDVRIERLRDISEADALAEGVERCVSDTSLVESGLANGSIHADRFAKLWESINGAGSWEMNPPVWCISFRRTEK